MTASRGVLVALVLLAGCSDSETSEPDSTSVDSEPVVSSTVPVVVDGEPALVTGNSYAPGDTLTVSFAGACDSEEYLGARLRVARNVTAEETAEAFRVSEPRGRTSYGLTIGVALMSGIREVDVVLPTQMPAGMYRVEATCSASDYGERVFDAVVDVVGDPVVVEAESVSVDKIGPRSFLLTGPAPIQGGTGHFSVVIQTPEIGLPAMSATVSIGPLYPLTVELVVKFPDAMPAGVYELGVTGADGNKQLIDVG